MSDTQEPRNEILRSRQQEIGDKKNRAPVLPRKCDEKKWGRCSCTRCKFGDQQCRDLVRLLKKIVPVKSDTEEDIRKTSSLLFLFWISVNVGVLPEVQSHHPKWFARIVDHVTFFVSLQKLKREDQPLNCGRWKQDIEDQAQRQRDMFEKLY